MQRALLFLSLAAPAAAVFTPTDRKELKDAVDKCLLEKSSGDCPMLANTNVPSRQGYATYGAIGEWDVSQVTNMWGIFKDKTDFNQDISSWDVSEVTRMNLMFAFAKAFNQDLSPWDVSKVTNMQSMFMDASNFNHELCGCTWVESSANQVIMFSGAGEGSGIASQACHDFVYDHLRKAPACYEAPHNAESIAEENAKQAAAEQAANLRAHIETLVEDHPDIVSEVWEAATDSCGS